MKTMRIITDDVRDVEAIGEAASGSVRWVVDTVGWSIGTGGGCQVVVVTVVDKVAKTKNALLASVGENRWLSQNVYQEEEEDLETHIGRKEAAAAAASSCNLCNWSLCEGGFI
ncbi:hypothetical protein HPP92_025735 [Vanilla planifolia]|uniref:Uncharacterized protein n=1 Tax=Vanilla planifolia TaxID=51239 RepID=A0A835PIE5_VANPL|nr:hypothetical protein HPP92_025735 [Vanilla planifolia]